MIRKTISAFAVTSLALTLSSCASTPSWHKSGVNAYDTQTALSDCRYTVGMNKVDKVEKEQLIRDCMQARGFRWYGN